MKLVRMDVALMNIIVRLSHDYEKAKHREAREIESGAVGHGYWLPAWRIEQRLNAAEMLLVELRGETHG